MVFLNHGSFGACPRPVFDAYQRWQRELERDPVDYFLRQAPTALREARAALGAFVGADEDELVFVTNATTAVNIIARSLGLGPGDTVLMTDHEYGACERAWRFVCGQRGARLERIKLEVPFGDRGAILERVQAGLASRPKVLFMSHITSPTALELPVAEACAMARAAGAWCVVDGAHAPGQIPLDLAQLGADFYAGNCHKWLCAPKGAGFLFARRELAPLIEPLVVSWGWQAEKPGPSRFIDEQEYTGTRDLAAFLAVPAAIRFQADNDWERVRTACHALAREAVDALLEVPGTRPVASDDSWFHQMAAVELPPCDPEALMDRLFQDHRIEIPVVAWEGRTLLRVSIQAYNDPGDVQALLKALPSALAAA